MSLLNIKEIIQDQPKYRIGQCFQAIYQDLISNWDQATVLPKQLRDQLNKDCSLEITAEISESNDHNTVKALLTLADGRHVETVLMRHQSGRNTVCVSCMVGCPMACTFCATGELKLQRKLTTEEIIKQVLFFSRYVKPDNQRISSVVFMGMGEPFLNYEAVLEAVRILQNPDFFNIGARHISISTCGILPGIKKLAHEDLPVNLAISLHAPNDKIRRKIMPVALGYTIKELLETVDDYLKISRRKVLFEYIMIKDLNDSDDNAKELAKLLKDKLCTVNLIEYNPTGTFTPSSKNRINSFKNILQSRDIEVTIRYKFGQEIQGACGQLANTKARQIRNDKDKKHSAK